MNTKQLPQISEAEYKVMKVIWAHTPISTNGITEFLVKENDWSPKTIQTMLARLVKKGALTYEKQGRMFIYSPLIRENDYRREASHSFLHRFYDGTLNAMVLNFIEQDQLSEDDIEALRRILDQSSTAKE